MLTRETGWKHFALVLGFSCCDVLTRGTGWKHFALVLGFSVATCYQEKLSGSILPLFWVSPVFSAHAELVGQLFVCSQKHLGCWALVQVLTERSVRGARATGDECSRSACGAHAGRVRTSVREVGAERVLARDLDDLPYPLRSFSVLMLLPFVLCSWPDLVLETWVIVSNGS